jgi:hypothetical protein
MLHFQRAHKIGRAGLACLILAASHIAPQVALGPAARSSPGAASSCRQASAVAVAHPNGYEIPVSHPVSASLHQAEAILFDLAQRNISGPRLFELEVNFDDDFLESGPLDSHFWIRAFYAGDCDQTQFLRTILPYDTERVARLAAEQFVPFASCAGTEMAIEPLRQLESEPESKHPPVQGWVVDLPEIWNIASRHRPLFGNGLDQCLIMTVARLRETDSRRLGCDVTVFNSSFWGGVIPSRGPKERLVKEPDRRTVVELIEKGVATTDPGSDSKNLMCQKGHYLIIDAGTGVELDSGTYLSCFRPAA